MTTTAKRMMMKLLPISAVIGAGRRGEHAGEAGQRDAEAEDRRDPAADVDAEGPGALGRLGRGPHDHADARPRQQQADRHADDDGEEAREDRVGREVDAPDA